MFLNICPVLDKILLLVQYLQAENYLFIYFLFGYGCIAITHYATREFPLHLWVFFFVFFWIYTQEWNCWVIWWVLFLVF